MEVIYDQDQIMLPVIFYDLILGQGKGFLFGVFIAGAGNLLFGRKLAFVCKPCFGGNQLPEIRIFIKVGSGNFHDMFKADDLFAQNGLPHFGGAHQRGQESGYLDGLHQPEFIGQVGNGRFS